MLATVVNQNTGDYDVYIGRGTKWGNPYKIGVEGSRAEVIAKYEQLIRSMIAEGLLSREDLSELLHKRLGCHCKPKPCHGDVLVEILIEEFGYGCILD